MAADGRIRLLVVLSQDDCIRVELHGGIPGSLEELVEEIKKACGLLGNFRLQYKDVDFGNTFVNVTSPADIKDLMTIKVISTEDTMIVLEPVDFSSSGPSSSQEFEDSDDTILLSSSSSESLRIEPWPRWFPIPQFSYDTECQLLKANAEYGRSNSRLTPNSKMLSDILEKLAEKVFYYRAYPDDAQFSEVAVALTSKHPCLKEPGSFNMSYGWKQRIKMKMANYRTQLRSHGSHAELQVNSLKRKRQQDAAAHPAKNVKKPKRAEANFYPALPTGETPETMEMGRISILEELKKRNCGRTKEKMEKTFGYRRQEIVDKQPSVEEVLTRWPALFSVEEINWEFQRITTVPLQVKFMAQLDKHTSLLLEIIKKKGGVVSQKTKDTLQLLNQDVDIHIKRECVLKCLTIYLGEQPDNLIKEYVGTEEIQDPGTMAIVIIKEPHDPDLPPADIKVMIEGIQVLSNLPSFADAFAMLLGLIYSLNLEYPKAFKFTFEAVQKILMELDNYKMSTKVSRLFNQLGCSA